MTLFGCAGSVSYTDKPLPPTPASREIEVVTLQALKRDYSIIGSVRTETLLFSSGGAEIKALKKQARELGADAISVPVNSGTYYSAQAIKWK